MIVIIIVTITIIIPVSLRNCAGHAITTFCFAANFCLAIPHLNFCLPIKQEWLHNLNAAIAKKNGMIENMEIHYFLDPPIAC